MVWLLALWFYAVQSMLPAAPPVEGPIDRILVDKSSRIMVLYQDGSPVRIWRIALGRTPVGAKEIEGDGKTPEGSFHIDRRNPGSAFHLSLGLDYPQPQHRAAAKALGAPPGGDIFIHGQPNAMPDGYRMIGDWTEGCIALSNAQIETLWKITPTGTAVEIRP